MRTLSTLLLASLTLLGFAQEKEGVSTTHKKIVDSKSPVTRAEAAAVLGKLERAFRTVLSVPSSGRSTLMPDRTPVTRAAVLAEFDRLVKVAEPAFKVTPRPVKFDSKRFTVKDTTALARLSNLVKGGYVAKIGPLATGARDTLTTAEFGDAVGFLLARVSEASTMPSTKWTPYLQRE
ncbi:hypothetical protein EON81_21160 [bacterium]|nr:MAG: hypothetical protein EON81_21160 [bacterium]